ncbi:MAG: hypothetical protein IT209_08895 [Armatimonadetes bacterium]|nr:hypothetical protein [Armatimonadota bacterium]
MQKWVTGVALATMLALCSFAGAATVTVLSDNFDLDPVNTASPPTLPPGWSGARANAVDIYGTVADGAPPSGNRVMLLHDDNGLSNLNTTIYRSFTSVTSGHVVAQYDAYFFQNTAGFGMRLTNGSTPTTGANWATGITFEGLQYYSIGGGPGAVSYQTKTTGITNDLSPATYQPNTWYTVKVDADVTAKTYRIWFGPRGGTLTEITPSGGQPFIKTVSNTQPDRIGGITFYTSNRGIPDQDAPGDMWVDNIVVTGDVTVANPATIAEAKATANGTLIEISGKVVTAGTDQLTDRCFYIQDDSNAIRVRVPVGLTVHQGDKVHVVGNLDRTADGGTHVKRNGEKEINAVQVDVSSGPFALPKPIYVRNGNIGGGPWGPLEPEPNDARLYVAQPGVFRALDTSDPDGWAREFGLNNIARYGVAWGKVVYVDDTRHFFYIDDGSGVIDGSTFSPDGTNLQMGVRVQVLSSFSLAGIEGSYAIVPGIIGSAAAGQLVSGASPASNVRVMRAVQEVFTDTNANGRWDEGEPFVDSNQNGVWDGIIFMQ